MSYRTWVTSQGRRIAVGLRGFDRGEAQGAVVVVPPVGFEGEVGHHIVQTLAARAEDAGFVVAVTDLTGTGDSDPLRGGEDLATLWRGDVEAVVSAVRQWAPGLPMNVVGIRLGAAVVAALPVELSARRVCWEPISGRHFLRTQELLFRFSQPAVEQDETAAGPELLGLDLDAAHRASVRSLSSPRAGDDARTLVVLDDDRVGAAANFTVDPYFGEVPTGLIVGIVDALTRGEAIPVVDPCPSQTSTFRLPDDRQVAEKFETVGPHRLLAVRTSPARPLPDVSPTCVVFTAQGAERASGPAALWTRLARDLAAAGYVSLRVDRRSIGWHVDTSVTREPNPFTPEAVEDVVEAVEHARTLGGRVVVVGSCVGGWLGLRAARQVPVDDVLALGVPAWSDDIKDFDPAFLDHWHGKAPEAASVPGAAPSPRERLVTWLRRRPWLLAVAMGPRQTVRAATYHSLGLPLLRRVPSRTAVHLVLAGRDLDFFRASGGPALVSSLRLARRRVQLTKVSGIDHALRTVRSQAVVRDELSRLLGTKVPVTPIDSHPMGSLRGL